MKSLGHIFFFCYRLGVRIKSKCFSILAAGAFAHFGGRTVLMFPARVSGEQRISIGDNVFIGSGSWLQTLPDDNSSTIALSVGDGTSIAGACVLSAVKEIILEEDVLLARNVYISDHMHRHTDTRTSVLRQGLDKIQPVRVKKGAWLGQNVVVCPGVTIGIGAVIGANSVVTRDIPDFAVAAGAPARIVKLYSDSNVAVPNPCRENPSAVFHAGHHSSPSLPVPAITEPEK
jgi:acetyltransferase-like isoleucine patch superfamily enzyme